MDKITPEKRSANMRAIRNKNTQPELAVRRLIYHFGYRYRLHRRDLPGKPDIVFVGRKKVIFVHGCYWHQHQNCQDGKVPTSNSEYWTQKFARNRDRDESNIQQLRAMGWATLVVWECEIKYKDALAHKLQVYLDS